MIWNNSEYMYHIISFHAFAHLKDSVYPLFQGLAVLVSLLGVLGTEGVWGLVFAHCACGKIVFFWAIVAWAIVSRFVGCSLVLWTELQTLFEGRFVEQIIIFLDDWLSGGIDRMNAMMDVAFIWTLQLYLAGPEARLLFESGNGCFVLACSWGTSDTAIG